MTKILVKKAITVVNSKSKNSRIDNTELTFGSVIFERHDGLFYENIFFEGAEWRPFLHFSTNIIELDNMYNRKSCTIKILDYQII
jgi:hypothetical protein